MQHAPHRRITRFQSLLFCLSLLSILTGTAAAASLTLSFTVAVGHVPGTETVTDPLGLDGATVATVPCGFTAAG